MKKVKAVLFFAGLTLLMASIPFLLFYSTHSIRLCNGIELATDGDQITEAALDNVFVSFVSKENNLSLLKVYSLKDHVGQNYQIEARENSNGTYEVRPYMGSGPGRGNLPQDEIARAKKCLQDDVTIINQLLAADYSAVRFEYGVLVPWKNNNSIED